ncbi:bactofilin family protein [Sphingobacterium corticibacterium]|uniref:Polymer-forming cytoskeletal protein n=1 Tax=Sphingobacterium corticibacterium TaxID=2484746 RepID=A0A4Q6XHI1_9SPHI|nr:polymer-forming cytoskeletal protein [Sphingobacterium corticibacterium]RZF59381.1 polymer-forming cytoskeletal protein [Sphingobacterium corticibacterium]
MTVSIINKKANSKGKKTDSRTTPTLIDRHCLIKGNISQTSAIRIEGVLEGDILEVGNLVIGESGTVNGNVHAKTITIFGQINGDVVATESVEIKNSGKVTGKVNTISLTIERGATYDGSITMGK